MATASKFQRLDRVRTNSFVRSIPCSSKCNPHNQISKSSSVVAQNPQLLFSCSVLSSTSRIYAIRRIPDLSRYITAALSTCALPILVYNTTKVGDYYYHGCTRCSSSPTILSEKWRCIQLVVTRLDDGQFVLFGRDGTRNT
jgi:hypothetical protein